MLSIGQKLKLFIGKVTSPYECEILKWYVKHLNNKHTIAKDIENDQNIWIINLCLFRYLCKLKKKILNVLLCYECVEDSSSQLSSI